MKINFYLKDSNIDDTETTIIRLFFNYNGKRLMYSTAVSVRLKHWSKKNMRIYSGASGYKGQNEILKSMKSALEIEYRRIVSNAEDIPAPSYFKEFLNNKFKNTTQTDNKTFFDYFNEFLQAKTKEGVDLRRYKSLKNHLIDIEKSFKIKLSYKTFDKKFYVKYINYFVDLKHANKTIKDRHLKDLKAFLNWSVFNDYTDKNRFKGIKFVYTVSEPHEIALTEKEITILHNLDLSENIRIQNIRDVFLLECYTGVRFSDLHKITKENVKGNELHIFTEKTSKNNVKIPLRPEVLEIINRYHSKDLEIPLKTNQKTNEYLKELGKIAGFDDIVSWVVVSGRHKTKYTKKRYEKMQTHTGRRTFITTNVERGLTPLQIMSITTHSTYSEFEKYYKPERINIKKQYLTAWSQVKTEHSTTELIKRLLLNGVEKNAVANSFSITIDDIDSIIK